MDWIDSMEIYVKVALTHGCYDVLHAGHLAHLEQCAAMSGRLIVSVLADRFVMKKFIIQDERTRMYQVSRVKGVDEVMLCNDLGPGYLLRTMRPDLYSRKDEYEEQIPPEYAIAK